MGRKNSIVFNVALFYGALWTCLPVYSATNSWVQYTNQGWDAAYRSNHAEAQRLQGLAIKEAEKFGKTDSRLYTAMDNLISEYKDQHKFVQAEGLYKKELQCAKAAFGDHPLVAGIEMDLGGFLFERGRFAEAEALEKSASNIYEKIWGPDHLAVADCQISIADASISQGKYKDAEEACKRALDIYEKSLGPNHTLIAGALNQYAIILNSTNRSQEASEVMKRRYTMSDKLKL